MPEEKTRTLTQNRALHLWYTLLAQSLNDAGFDLKKVIKVDIPFTDYAVKEYLWRPIQKTMFGFESTTKLKRKQIDEIYDVINREIGIRTGVHVPFPSIEQIMEEERLKNIN